MNCESLSFTYLLIHYRNKSKTASVFSLIDDIINAFNNGLVFRFFSRG